MVLPRGSLSLQQEQQNASTPPTTAGGGGPCNMYSPRPRQSDAQSRSKQSRRPAETHDPKPAIGQIDTAANERTRHARQAIDITEELSQPSSKRRKVDCSVPESASDVVESPVDPVRQWAESGYWPACYATMSDVDATNNKRVKRVRTPSPRPKSPSYASSLRSGEVPPAHSADAETLLAQHGINLQFSSAKQYLSTDSQDLCIKMLGKAHDEYVPQVSYPMSKIGHVLDIVASRNEQRVIRDLSPLLIPSAENLAISGYQDLKHIREELDTQWTKVSSMGGPTPKPDFMAGIDCTEFTPEELKKLKNYTSPNRAAFFTNNVLFPFFICEVKCSEQPISRAGRQCGHSGGVAARAMFELHRAISEEAAEKLNGQILLFSVAHDHQTVEVYAHFAYLHSPTSQPVIYRHRVCQVFLDDDNDESITRMQKIRDFVIEVYFDFSKRHLERIRAALELMPEPEFQSEEERNKQTMPPPSQSATQMLTQQLEDLKKQYKQQQEDYKQQQEDYKQQQEKLQEDLRRQQKDLEDQKLNQRLDYVKALDSLRLELETQRQESSRDKANLNELSARLLSLLERQSES